MTTRGNYATFTNNLDFLAEHLCNNGLYKVSCNKVSGLHYKNFARVLRNIMNLLWSWWNGEDNKLESQRGVDGSDTMSFLPKKKLWKSRRNLWLQPLTIFTIATSSLIQQSMAANLVAHFVIIFWSKRRSVTMPLYALCGLNFINNFINN